MRLYIGITDEEWFRLLRDEPALDEVNFWQPGGTRLFRALSLGEPFLFKLHSPQDFIVGGGFFGTASLLPCSLAWEAFERKNGAATFREMRRRIEKYRRAAPEPHEDYTIGCILLQQPFFFGEQDWIPIPRDFAKNIVQGKTYDVSSGTGREVWEAVRFRLEASPVGEDSLIPHEGSLLSDPALIRRRLGQGTFRVLVTDTYERHCTVTGEKALPTLDAAHIRPVSEGGQHRVDNGLLFRADIHRLYDRGYVTVTPDYRFRVSRRLKSDFANGEPYFPLDKQEIWLPPSCPDRPSRELLEWHADTRYLG